MMLSAISNNENKEEGKKPSLLKRFGLLILHSFNNSDRRKLTGKMLLGIKITSFLVVMFYVYTGFFGILSPESHRGVLLGYVLVLIFLYYPALKHKSPKARPSVVDWFLVACSVFVATYFIIRYQQFYINVGNYTTLDIVAATMTIVLFIEGARRSSGIIVPFICLIFLLYTVPFVARSLPNIIASRGFSWERVSIYLFSVEDGIFGGVARTMASYVVPFLVFGALMKATGVGKFFIELPYALFGHFTGGTAFVAIIAGCLMGMVSGSPIAVVLAIGTFMLPLMNKAGYEKIVGSGIVAVASSGAMFMPPVMGACAFFMAQFTGTTYSYVCLMAFAPALMFYLVVGIQSRLYAKRRGILPIPKSELPDWRKVLKKGWYLSLPLIMVITMLMMGRSASSAALYSSILCLLVSLFNKENRITFKKFFEAIASVAKDMMVIVCIVGAIGILIGVINLTGIGNRFAQILVFASNGSLPIMILFVAAAAFVLGMGTNIGSVYLVLAALVPAALNSVGCPVFGAHLMIIWFAQLGGLTPPVCLVAFSAASMNDVPPFKTGWKSLRLGICLMIMPILFAYTNILDVGTVPFFIDLATSLVACFTLSAAIQAYWVRKNHIIETLALWGATLLLFWPSWWMGVIGAAIFAVIWIEQRMTKNAKFGKAKKAAALTA